MAEKKKNDKFRLEIPFDASGVEDFKPEQDIKILVQDREGESHSDVVKLSRAGKGTATFMFEEQPGSLKVIVGPANASDDELMGLQTMSFNISSRRWASERELKLAPIEISAYYWHWWLIWCRTFTIRGRVVCPDGSPVPGAEVCAYDVDGFGLWTSTQQVGCDTTDINGTFEITFRWCCGWWPWWWWRRRVWQLDPAIIQHIQPLLEQFPKPELARFGNQPSLAPFSNILSEEELGAGKTLTASDVNSLPQIRNRLLENLPASSELERLHIWPWWSWYPWWDCTPDIIFKIKQDCDLPDTVILDEGYSDTRWNIPNPFNVTLTVDEACCRPVPCQDPPCYDGECLIVDQVCGFQIDEIGGNLGAAPSPAGYAHPGPVPINTSFYHRPFAGTIPIWKNPGDLLNVDYYEIEYWDGATWQPLPPGAEVDFKRRYWDTAAGTALPVGFSFTAISGHNVVETREHYELTSGMTWDFPGADAWWLSTNWNLLLPLDTTKFNDGTYRFHVVGWDLSGGALVNRRVIPICGSDEENEFVLTFDNRVSPDLAHPTSHPCGPGYVHACTTEPDTHILAVRINGELVEPCDTVEATSGTLEIDFLASDPAGHLASYVLRSKWGLSNVRNLLSRPGVSVTALGPSPTGWFAGQSTGNYGTALSQGAGAPSWQGGQYRLSMPVSEAFPEPCCYLLELVARKRTIIGGRSGLGFSCGSHYRNETEYTIGVGVCPPEEGQVNLTAEVASQLQRT
jgi:hypothetical protein